METEISGHNNDVIMKATAAMFKDQTLEVLRMTQIEEWLREEGKLEGKLEGEMKDARNALIEGIEPIIVAKITGLPLEIIQKIKGELAN